MSDLFGNPTVTPKEPIRTLGLWQPFASLMLHGKVETRKVRKGKKPPFPNGKYLLYSTLKATPEATLHEWCSPEQLDNIKGLLRFEDTRDLCGFALLVAELRGVTKMSKHDEAVAFIQYKEHPEHDVWMLVFEDIQRIEPFAWKFGGQGVGFVPDSERGKIIILDV